MSIGTSKLYHYAYPFLPPLALAAGYLIALFLMLAPVPLRNALEWIEDRLASRPTFSGVLARPWIQWLLQAAILLAAAVAIITALTGRFRVALPGGGAIRSSGMVRPIVVMVACAVLARVSARGARLVAAIVAVSVLPIGMYFVTLQQLPELIHPLRSTSECIQRIQAQGSAPPGLFVNRPESSWWHPLDYYFRRIRPWTQTTAESADLLNRYLYDPMEWRPVLIDERLPCASRMPEALECGRREHLRP